MQVNYRQIKQFFSEIPLILAVPLALLSISFILLLALLALLALPLLLLAALIAALGLMHLKRQYKAPTKKPLAMGKPRDIYKAHPNIEKEHATTALQQIP